MTISAIEVTYFDDSTDLFPTDREPWLFRDTLCIGEPGNLDPFHAERIPERNVRKFRVISSAADE